MERDSGFLWSSRSGEDAMSTTDFKVGGNPELPALRIIGQTKYAINQTKKYLGRIGVYVGVNENNGKIKLDVLPFQRIREFDVKDLIVNPDETEQQRARDLEKRRVPRKRKSRCEIPKVKWPKHIPKKKKGWKVLLFF